MKYFSEKLNRVYDTVDELTAAENAAFEEEVKKKLEEEKRHAEELKKKEEKAKRKEEISKALQEMREAQHNYNNLIDAYLKDYGHYDINVDTSLPSLFSKLFNL